LRNIEREIIVSCLVMHARLQKTFDSLEQQRAGLLNELRPLSAEILTSAPADKWSIIYILSHLITGERTGLEYVRKKMLGIDGTPDAGLFEEFKMIGLVISQRLPFLKFKVPKLIEERTVVYPDLATIEKEWDVLRRDWAKILENIPDQHVNRKIFRHVVAGRLNINQGLRFFGEHIIHHKPQIQRLIQDASRG
jgi:hypothetical protein